MTLYSDSLYLYRLVYRRGYFYRRKRKRVHVKGRSFFVRLQRIPFVPPRPPLGKKPSVKRVSVPGVWVSRKEWLYRIQKIYGKINWDRSEEPKKTWAYVRMNLTSPAVDRVVRVRGHRFAFLSPKRKIPPYHPSFRYISYELWYFFTIRDEETGHVTNLLWPRRHYTARKLTIDEMYRQVKKLFTRKERSLFTLEELRLRFPTRFPSQKGLFWKDAVAGLPDFIEKDLEELEGSDYEGEKSATFVGFALYSEPGQVKK